MTKLILSCDGGGVRGLASITFLQFLEKYLIEKTEKGIFETFDMFIGTSIGGIITTLTSLLKLKADEAASLFTQENINKMMNKSIGDKIFGMMQFHPKYDGIGKREVIADVLKNHTGDTDILLDSAEKPTLVVAYDVEGRRSKILKSYSKEKINALDAMDATSAAPMYYPSVELSGVVRGVNKQMFLIDGGVVCNNPSMCAYAEAKNLWPKEEIKILSIGTGIVTRMMDGKGSQDYGMIQWMHNGFMDIMFDDSIVDYQIRHILRDNYMKVTGEIPHYVSHSMDDTSKDNFMGLKRLGEEWFHSYKNNAMKFIEEKEFA